MSDYKAAALMLDGLPPGNAMLGDKGYDGDRRPKLRRRLTEANMPAGQ
jgi:hypothetical protein